MLTILPRTAFSMRASNVKHMLCFKTQTQGWIAGSVVAGAMLEY